MEDFPASRDLLGKSASAYEHLRRAVVKGHLRPNRRLSPTDLAAQYRISVTPVREALVRMAAEGFLTWEASHGYFTKLFTVAEQTDLHELMAVSLNVCIHRTDPAPSAALEALAGALEGPDAANAEGVTVLVETLAGALVERSGNQVLPNLMRIMLDRTQLVRRLDLESEARASAAVVRVSGLAAAVLAEDASTALSVLGQHFADRRRRLPGLVDRANLLIAAAKYP